MYNCRVDDREGRRPLADDPSFLDSLADLDRGLTNDAPALSPLPAPPSAPPPPPLHNPSDSAPVRLPGQAKRRLTLPPSITAPFEALTVPESAPPVEEDASSRRPLLELFPRPADADRPAPLSSAPPRSASAPGIVVPPELSASTAPAPAPAPAPIAPTPRPQTLPPASPLDDAAFGITAVKPSAAERAYGLVEKPFALSTDPRFFYHSTPHDAVSQQLLTAIRNRDGLVVLTGDLGTGKTTLCRVVMEQLDRRTLTSFVGDPFLSGEELLRKVLADFGVARDFGVPQDTREDATHGRAATGRDLIGTLRSFVESLASLEARAVVILDEAQNAPPEVLEQVRTLCEAAEASSHLQVVLVGQPALVTLLRQPDNRTLQQRVTVRGILAPLPADEIGAYIQHRLSIAGSSRVQFDEAALAGIHRLSHGIPRVVNLICDRALAHASASAGAIGAAAIDAAAQDLDLGEPASKARRIGTRVAVAVWVTVCVLLGGLAAWAFKDVIAGVLGR